MFTARQTSYSDPPGVSAKPAPGNHKGARAMNKLRKFLEFHRGEIVIALFLVAALPWLLSE